jgi:phosphoribosylanthranilate isomerase
VKPIAVDVSSGVESQRGIKDIEKMRAFISNARQAAKDLAL